MDKLRHAIALIYIGYIPKHISISVLLTPGTTTPIDIRIPDNIKNTKDALPLILYRLKLFSKTTKKYPIPKVIRVYNK